MSAQPGGASEGTPRPKVTFAALAAKKADGEPIVMVTALSLIHI